MYSFPWNEYAYKILLKGTIMDRLEKFLNEAFYSHLFFKVKSLMTFIKKELEYLKKEKYSEIKNYEITTSNRYIHIKIFTIYDIENLFTIKF